MDTERLRITLFGAVQGVGFRPFVYRLAASLNLPGWVRNSGAGLEIEVEGQAGELTRFLERLDAERPPAAVVLGREISRLAAAGFDQFRICSSTGEDPPTAAVLPDLATCPQCRGELFDPADRRNLYPFINCTRCGPRYSIILDIPYDRHNTTMRGFALCPECERQYADPLDRRFHAQPLACAACGPRLNTTVESAACALRDGLIVALKGIGGYQLLADARQPGAVEQLRRRKHREEKPFAVMMPSLAMVKEYCLVSAAEAALLQSPAAPIVLLRPAGRPGIAPNVAASSPLLGIMLPYSPLHHLLMEAFRYPVVATSGNRSDEPIAIETGEAHARLAGIADLFVDHNRPIARPCDDSVARVIGRRETVLRRARGYAPLPVRVPKPLRRVLAVGGHLKNSIAIATGRHVILSQHVGDLDTPEARRAFEDAIAGLLRIYDFQPELVASDLHPDYASTLWAEESGLPAVRVQHHQAHLAACAAENDVEGEWLGVSWDGAGYGTDGTIWGGEFFMARHGVFERFAHLRPFRLPGGEAAFREGWRPAASLCRQAGIPRPVPNPLEQMLAKGINSPYTSSVGRLFDGVAALTGIARESRFEGQAAMLLERAIGGVATTGAYPLEHGDWRELIRKVTADVEAGVELRLIAARFHNALANWIVEVAGQAAIHRVVLSGGVFQNAYLVERATGLLEAAGHMVFTHQRIPPNDGGIALGQAVIAGAL